MAETTSDNAFSAPSNEQAQGTSYAPQQSDAQVSQPDRPVNLFELPEFRAVQSRYDSQINTLQQQLYQQQQMLEAATTRDMDEYERAQYHIQKLQSELARRDQMQAMSAADMNRYRVLKRIENQTGVSVNDLDRQGFTNADDAWTWALEVARRNGRRQENRDASMDVDLGGGTPTTAISQWKADVQDAMQRKDAVAYTRLMRQRPG